MQNPKLLRQGQRSESGFNDPPVIEPPNITLNPRVKPMAIPANGTILKFFEVVVANTTYTNVNVITVSKIRALTMLSSEGNVTLADISEPKIE